MSKDNLSRPTLILNKGWQAIGISPAKKALTKVFNNMAKIIDHEDYNMYSFDEWIGLDVLDENKVIRLNKYNIRFPEVVVLLNYDKKPKKQPDVKLTRRNLLIRDGYKCQYTGRRVYSIPPAGKEGLEATIDHVIPRSKGGKTTWDNVVIASLEANVRKADKDLKDCGYELLSSPCKPKWNPLYVKAANYIDVCDKNSVPLSWRKFINISSDFYWDIELED